MIRNTLRHEVILELEFIQSLGSKIFLFPFIGRSKFQIIGYLVTILLVFCTAIQLTLTLFSYSTKDWLEIINVAPNLGVVLMTVIKYLKIYIHKEFYNGIFYHFRDDMWDIVCPQFIEHQKIIKNYKWVTKIINRFLFFYSIPLILVVDSFPYIVMLYENKVHGVNDELLYPFDGWYPFDKVKWYAAAYVWESFMTALVVFVFLFSNMMHLCFVIFICMELRIIGNQLENIISHDDTDAILQRHNTDVIHRAVTRKLKFLIKKHDFLIRTSAKLDAILGDAMLLNYSLGAIFICLTAFTFTVVENLYKSIRYFSMCVSLLVEIFNQCLIGQILSDHSVNLTEAVYSCNWLYANPETKKIMLMLMVRTQKPFVLTANGYLVMNMNTFSKICSTSYQLFNLLRTIYSQ